MQKDAFHNIMKSISYERGKVIGVIVAVIAFAGITAAYGGQSKTMSPTEQGKMVTADELEREVNARAAELMSQQTQLDAEQAMFLAEIERKKIQFQAKQGQLANTATAFQTQVEIAVEDLERQDEQRQRVMSFATQTITSVASGNPVNIVDTLLLGGTLLVGGVGAGATYDKIRGNKVIEQLKKSKQDSA